MKKIISLFSVLAIVASMVTTVAHADANNKLTFKEKLDGNILTLDVVCQTNKDGVTIINQYLEFAAVIDAGAVVVSSEKNESLPGTVTVQSKDNLQSKKWGGYTASYNSGYEAGTITLGTIKLDLSGMTAPANVTHRAGKTNQVKIGTTVVTGDFTDECDGYTITPPSGPSVVVDSETYTPEDSTVVVGGKNYGFGGEVKANGGAFTGIKFVFNNGTKDATWTWNFGTTLNADVTFGLNLMGVPAGITVTATSITPVVAE